MYVYIINLMIILDLKIDLNLLEVCVCMDVFFCSGSRTWTVPCQSALLFQVCDSKDGSSPLLICNTF